jgi:hypothetical protein
MRAALRRSAFAGKHPPRATGRAAHTAVEHEPSARLTAARVRLSGGRHAVAREADAQVATAEKAVQLRVAPVDQAGGGAFSALPRCFSRKPVTRPERKRSRSPRRSLPDCEP